ncbi:MAG: hypothetical protein WC700_20330 [Gemmatimonadaceae bacterium]
MESALSVLVQDSEPTVVALAHAVNRERSEEVAAAVAAMRAAWAWDERTELPLVVNGVSLHAAPRYVDNRRWDVTVRSDAG